VPRLILGLEGALGSFSVALVASDGRMEPRVACADPSEALERGLRLVAEVLDGVPIAELGAVAVGTGPGRFTGLRVALAFAKSFAFGAGLSLTGVNSYDILEPENGPTPSAAFVSGRAGFVCVRLRTADATLVRCGTRAAVVETIAAALAPGSMLAITGATEGAAAGLGERGIIVRSPCTAPVPPALAVALRAARITPAASPHALRADYGEAVRAIERKVPPPS
jgi:tRNA A37 threonylcarbamoyladenosine modification protein TsaB